MNDVDYTTLIWEFLSRHKFVGANIDETENIGFEVYPNPASDLLNISCEEDVLWKYIAWTEKLFFLKNKSRTNTVSVQDLKSGHIC